MPSFVLPCDSRRLRVRPFAAAPPVCAGLLVATHQAPARPLSPASQLLARPCLVVAYCSCALPHHYASGSNASGVAAAAFFSALPASSTPAVPMAFRVRTLPPCQHVSTSANSTCITWHCLVATLHLAVHALHRLLSTTRHSLALLLSCAFSSVRDGSLLTSRTSSNSQAWILTPTI